MGAAVKLTSLTVKAVGVGGQAPRRVKLFTNRPNLGFNEATSFPASQEFILSEADLEGKPLQLKYDFPLLLIALSCGQKIGYLGVVLHVQLMLTRLQARLHTVLLVFAQLLWAAAPFRSGHVAAILNVLT